MMGRIGDGDVHAAYVEFRAKESDKVLLNPLLPEHHPPLLDTHLVSSVCRRNASTVNLFVPKIPLVSVRICSNARITLLP